MSLVKLSFVLTFTIFVATTNVAAAKEITPHDPLPRTILQCGGGIVTEVGSRLEGRPSSGSSIRFNNDGGSVSEEIVPAIQHSRVGDHVMICLVYIPKDCPAGDDRGSEYTVTNLRNLESWTLPSSQHGCGGA